jgi:type VI protein secretion system component Hcp
MSTDKTDASKKDATISSADDLTKTTSKGDVELSEEELKRVTGGDKGRADFQSLSIQKLVDKSTPL